MAEPTPDRDLDRMAAYFRMLADPSRLAILRSMIANGELSVGQAAAETGHSQANASKHLKVMAAAGVLSRRKDGLRVFYRLADPAVERVFRLVSDIVRGGDR
ncbi:MAG: helix-turn-helix transcriptional regulator [Planctomycetes bacterium]|nr:helix-turn-helix transcriptional regulator [Planctomycetota bacterium]